MHILHIQHIKWWSSLTIQGEIRHFARPLRPEGNAGPHGLPVVTCFHSQEHLGPLIEAIDPCQRNLYVSFRSYRHLRVPIRGILGKSRKVVPGSTVLLLLRCMKKRRTFDLAEVFIYTHWIIHSIAPKLRQFGAACAWRIPWLRL